MKLNIKETLKNANSICDNAGVRFTEKEKELYVFS